MKTSEKRIRLREDGFYYPQSRCCFIWWDYDDNNPWTSCTSVRFGSQLMAQEFLDTKHMQELREIELAKHAKTINWKHPA